VKRATPVVTVFRVRAPNRTTNDQPVYSAETPKDAVEIMTARLAAAPIARIGMKASPKRKTSVA